MNIEICASPVFWVPLNLRQANILAFLSSHHYDGVCKDASRVGGFVYGWINHLSFNDGKSTDGEPVKVRGEFRQLDTCMKILEGRMMLKTGKPTDEEDLAIAHALANDLANALYQANRMISPIKFETDNLSRKGTAANG